MFSSPPYFWLAGITPKTPPLSKCNPKADPATEANEPIPVNVRVGPPKTPAIPLKTFPLFISNLGLDLCNPIWRAKNKAPLAFSTNLSYPMFPIACPPSGLVKNLMMRLTSLVVAKIAF